MKLDAFIFEHLQTSPFLKEGILFSSIKTTIPAQHGDMNRSPARYPLHRSGWLENASRLSLNIIFI